MSLNVLIILWTTLITHVWNYRVCLLKNSIAKTRRWFYCGQCQGYLRRTDLGNLNWSWTRSHTGLNCVRLMHRLTTSSVKVPVDVCIEKEVSKLFNNPRTTPVNESVLVNGLLNPLKNSVRNTRRWPSKLLLRTWNSIFYSYSLPNSFRIARSL